MADNSVKEKPLYKEHKKNIEYVEKKLGVGVSFDILNVETHYAGKDMMFFMIDGMIKDDIMHYLMRFLAKMEEGDLEPNTLQKLIKEDIPYVEISTEDTLDKAIFWVTCGSCALFVEGLDKAIIIDARTYPARGPAEPDVERVVRGARDGFVETIIFNTALTRRRVRDPSLRMEYMSVGRRSKTDICISYIEDITNPELVKSIKDSVSKIDTDGLPMGEKTVEEFIAGHHFNPFPIVRYTERPDTAAVHLFEGHVLIFVDGSPVVLIAPSTVWNQLQHVEEYRQKPIIGSYLRIIRYLAVWASIFALPLWYLLATHTELMDHPYHFITVDKDLEIAILIQIILLEVGLDALRMATIHTPTSLATALGLVAALMIGQISVDVGLISKELVLYMSFAAIGTFATPLYELSLANRFVRVILILVTAAFGVVGYVVGSTVLIIYMARMKTVNIPYLWPFLPFSFRGMRDVVFRIPMPLKNRRPIVMGAKDPDK